MAISDVSTDGVTFKRDGERFVMVSRDGTEHELLDELAYNAAIAAVGYGTTGLAPEFFKS